MIRSRDLFMRKLLATGLALALTLSLLTGCGKEEPAKQEAQTDQQAAESSEAPDTSADTDMEETGESEAPAKFTNAKETYLAFLKGDAAATAKVDFNGILKIGDSYTYPEICDFFEGTSTDNYGYLLKLNTASYAFVDCMKDGTQELAVSQYWGENGEVEIILLFTFKDGELTLAKKSEGGYRTSLSINKYGIITNSGSNGAMSHGASYETLDSDGNDLFLYDVQTDMSIEMPIVPYFNIPDSERPEDYPENDWAEESEDGSMLCRDIYSFIPFTYEEGAENKEYYNNLIYVFYDENGEDVTADPTYTDLYKSLGIRTCTQAEANQLVSKHLKSLGLDDEIMNYNAAPDWTQLQ